MLCLLHLGRRCFVNLKDDCSPTKCNVSPAATKAAASPMIRAKLLAENKMHLAENVIFTDIAFLSDLTIAFRGKPLER